MEARARARSARDDARVADGAPRNESYYASEYNAPEAREGAAVGRAASARAKWGLRGFVPPAHLRVDGYAYDAAEDSASGCARRMMFVAPRTIEEHEVMFVNDGGGGRARARRRGDERGRARAARDGEHEQSAELDGDARVRGHRGVSARCVRGASARV